MFHSTKVSRSLCQRAQRLLIKRSFVTGEGRRSPGMRCDVDGVASRCECSGEGGGWRRAGRAGRGEALSWVSRQITLCERDVSSSSHAATQRRLPHPSTLPPRRLRVFDVRKSRTSGGGAKGNRSLGLTFGANAGLCYAQKLETSSL